MPTMRICIAYLFVDGLMASWLSQGFSDRSSCDVFFDALSVFPPQFAYQEVDFHIITASNPSSDSLATLATRYSPISVTNIHSYQGNARDIGAYMSHASLNQDYDLILYIGSNTRPASPNWFRSLLEAFKLLGPACMDLASQVNPCRSTSEPTALHCHLASFFLGPFHYVACRIATNSSIL